jgi:hypothetical protein
MINSLLGIYFSTVGGLDQICAFSAEGIHESIFHLFWDCPITKQLWFNILSSLNLNLRWTGTSLQDCMENWSLLDTIYPHLPVIVCWFVWISRNKAIFENTPISINSICFLILGDLNPVRHKKNFVSRAILPLPLLDGNTAWFDGASQNSGLHCGAGGKILLCDGSWINWTLNCGLRTNTKAELLGAWVSLYLASRHNILNLQLERAFLLTFNFIRSTLSISTFG